VPKNSAKDEWKAGVSYFREKKQKRYSYGREVKNQNQVSIGKRVAYSNLVPVAFKERGKPGEVFVRLSYQDMVIDPRETGLLVYSGNADPRGKQDQDLMGQQPGTDDDVAVVMVQRNNPGGIVIAKRPQYLVLKSMFHKENLIGAGRTNTWTVSLKSANVKRGASTSVYKHVASHVRKS
jgi:hypothetical protein